MKIPRYAAVPLIYAAQPHEKLWIAFSVTLVFAITRVQR